MKQILVAGLGQFGSSIALALESLGFDVIAIDTDEKIVQELSNKLTYVVCGNVADEANLKALGADSVDVAIIGIKNLQSSVLATLMLKEIGIRSIIAKASDDMHGKILEKIGADRIVYPERDTANRIATAMYYANALEFESLPDGTGFMKIKVPDSLIGKNLIEADFSKKFNINVASVTRGLKVMVNPDPKEPLQGDDILTLFGTNESLDKVSNTYND